MSIRSDIRASLVAHAAGRTSEELADKYTDYEPAVIALELARLRRDGFIRSVGLRDGRPIYVIAAWPEDAGEADEDLALPAPRPPTQPQPQRQPIDGADMDTSERILKAIEAGPKRRKDLESMMKGKDNLDHILEALIDAKKIMRQGHGRGTEYAKRANGSSHGAPPKASADANAVAGYQIESGIPIPIGRGHNSPLVEVLLAIAVNQSIVHNGDPKSAINSKSVRTTGRKFTVRALSEGKQFRVWRTQ